MIKEKSVKYFLIISLIISTSVNLFAWQKIQDLEKEIWNKKEPVSVFQKEEMNKKKNDEIIYKTFSSPKANFTFEYPSNWVYDEKEISTVDYDKVYDEKENTWVSYNEKEIKTMAWGFYPNLEGNYRNRPPYLEVYSPTYETVDFFSLGYKGIKSPYQLNTFPTNDPKTYVTYEQGESGGKLIFIGKKEKLLQALLA